MDQKKKDLIALFVICYIGPIAFYVHTRGSIRSDLDLYIFVTAFSLMLILPVFVIIYKTGGLKKHG